MDDRKLITLFLEHCRRRGLSRVTLHQRQAVLVKFSREVGIGAADTSSIIEWLDRDSLTNASRATLRSTLSCAYAWWVDEELVRKNPVQKVPKFKVAVRGPRPIPREDLALALSEADPNMRCYLLLGARLGLRVGEIAMLTVEGIDFEAGTLTFVGKGNKERSVPLTSDVRAALAALGDLPASGRLWPLLSPQSLSQRISYFLAKLGISSRMHSTRHRALTDLYQASHDIVLTQRIAGHSSTATTGIYADADMSKAGPIMEGLGSGG